MKVPKKKIEKATRVFLSLGAKEVYVFGSAATDQMVKGSDLDFAVRGLPPSSFYLAVGKVLCAIGGPLDVVDLDDNTTFTRNLLDRGQLVRVG